MRACPCHRRTLG